MEWLRFVFAAICILGGIIMEGIAVFGIYKFRFVLNRMHAAAIGDTLALLLITIGLALISGFTLFTLKLFLVLMFLWMASSVSSHVLSRMEVTIDETAVHRECEVHEE